MGDKLNILKMVHNRNLGLLTSSVSDNSANTIRSKLEEIPGAFYEKHIFLDNDEISLIQFSMLTLRYVSRKN